MDDDAAPPPSPQRLPGLGHRLDLVDEDGRPVTVVRLGDGRLAVHVDGTPVVLAPSQASALGALASGRVVFPPGLVERSSNLLGGLSLDWITVPENGAVVGRSIEEVEFRRRTGTTIVAILRGHLPVIDPDPDQRLEAGDDLVIACRPGEREAIERFVAEGR
jgi:TrkA domain protein